MTKQPNLLEKAALIIAGAIGIVICFAIIDIIVLTISYLLNELFTLLN